MFEDKWENFFRDKDGNTIENDKEGQEEEGELHTMPSFRDGAGHEDEKTLSVIYDDTDLARDHLSNFGLGPN